MTVLSEQGAPTPVAWTRIRPPRSLMDTIGNDAIRPRRRRSPLSAKYGQTVDRESAYEQLTAKVAAQAPQPAPGPPPLPDLPPRRRQPEGRTPPNRSWRTPR